MIGRRADYLEWGTHNWGAALDFWTTHTRQSLPGCKALEIGGRNGGLSLWLARQGASVLCADIGGPSKMALEKHRTAGVTHRIAYADINATSIPHTDQFDVVVFKSVLGVVGRDGGRRAQADAIQAMYKAVRPGGELFFAEKLVASPLHGIARRQFVPWGASWRYVTIDDMQEFLAPFAQVRFRTVGFAAPFGRTSGQRRVLNALDRLCLDAITPERWRSVIVGLARK